MANSHESRSREGKRCIRCSAPIPPGRNYRTKQYCSRPCYELSKRSTPEQIEAAFWAKVDKSGDCWLWTGYKQPDGYGQLRANGKFYNSHKFSYEMANGPIPKSLEVMHSCHVRHCVNPSHMRLGTHAQNVAESVAEKRHTFGERNHHAKLTEALVLEIRRRFKFHSKRRTNARELAREYGVNENAVYLAGTGRTWKTLAGSNV